MPQCRACGNDKLDDDGDAYVKKMMGCDADLPEGQELLLPDGTTTRRCPRANLDGVYRYLLAYPWWEKGQLDHIYPADDTPADLVEAFNIIASEREAIKGKLYGS